MDPHERVRGVIRLMFDKFQELGSARQVLLWAQDQVLQLPIGRRNSSTACKIEWRPAAYHTVLQILRHPVYAGAYVFGRTTQRTRIVDGRARKTTGHTKPMTSWNVLIRDHHPRYISWEQYEANQRLISENAHMQRRTERKSARGGRSADRFGTLRSLRPDDAGVLRLAVGPCSSLSLSRRRQSRRRMAMHRCWGRSD